MSFSEWKSMGITIEIFAELKNRQQFAKDFLAENAGQDPRRDGWYCGVIAAYEDMLNIELEKESDDDN